MTRPVTVMSVFQEARCLPMALGCLPDDVEVHVIDGAYEAFPHDAAYSTDGTLDIARAWGATVHRFEDAWADQVAKRTYTLSLAPVVFILDADELLLTDYPALPDGYDVGWVWMRSPIYPQPYPEPRVLRMREGWHYDKRHHWIYDADGDLVCSHKTAGPKYKHIQLPTVVDNMRDWRDRGREQAKKAYGKERNRAELRHRSE